MSITKRSIFKLYVKLNRVLPRVLQSILKVLMIFSTAFSLLVPLAILIIVVIKSVKFFQIVPILDFLFGTTWAPRDDIVKDHFGVVPVLMGTFTMCMVAMTVIGIFGTMLAVYMAEYAKEKVRKVLKLGLDMFAGVPTIVYGFFVTMFFAPLLVKLVKGTSFVIDPESTLLAGIFIGLSIIPFFSSLLEDVLKSVPSTLYEAAITMGATKAEALFQIIFPYIKRQLISCFLFALSRCLGETVIMLIAGGLMAKLTLNPFESNTTMTVQIINLASSDSDYSSPRTLCIFAASLLLFLITFVINSIGNVISNSHIQGRK